MQCPSSVHRQAQSQSVDSLTCGGTKSQAAQLQRQGFQAARLEPIGQLLKFPCESTEVTDRLRIAIRGNRHLDLRCPDIDSGRVGFQHSG